MNSKTTTNLKKESFQTIKKPHMSTVYTQHIKSQTKVENSHMKAEIKQNSSQLRLQNQKPQPSQNLRRPLPNDHQNEAEYIDSGYDAVDDDPSLESDDSRSSSQSVKGNTAVHRPSSIHRITDLNTQGQPQVNSRPPTKKIVIKKSEEQITATRPNDSLSDDDEDHGSTEDADEDTSSGVDEYQMKTAKRIEKKGYSLYEDWRILESVDFFTYLNGRGSFKISKSQFKDLIDPRTGEKVLSEERGDESMKERYKRKLKYLTEKDRKEIRKFAADHKEAEMRRHYCLFKRSNDGMTFVKISNKPVLEETQGKRRTLDPVPYKHEPKDEEGGGKVDQLWDYVVREEKKQERGRSYEPGRAKRTQYVISDESDQEDGEDDVKYVEVNEQPRRVEPRVRDRKKQSPRLKYMNEEPILLNNSYRQGTRRRYEQESIEELAEEEQVLRARTFNRERYLPVLPKTIKQAKASSMLAPRVGNARNQSLSQNFKVNAQQNSEAMYHKGRKTQREQDVDFSIWIYVDCDQGERKFMKEEEQLVWSDSENQLKRLRLRKIAKKYQIELNDALRLFHATSGDYDDLEEYLITQNGDFLWNEKDDHEVINNNLVALKYMKRIKGEERVQKRRAYLLKLEF